MKTYTVSRASRLVLQIITIILIIIALLGILCPLFQPVDRSIYMSALPGCAFMLILTTAAFIEATIGKLRLTEDRIIINGIVNRRLRYTDIAGYRITDNFIKLVPNNHRLKPIRIRLPYEHLYEVENWIKANFMDLNSTDVTQYTWRRSWQHSTKEEKAAAKRDVIIAMVAMFLLLAVTIFTRDHREIRIVCAYLLGLTPWAGVFLMIRHRGLVTLENTPKGEIRPITSVLLVPSIVLLIGVTMYASFAVFTDFLIPCGIVAILAATILSIVVMVDRGEEKLKKTEIIINIILFSMLYSFGTVASLNVHLDKSSPVWYTVKVLDKRQTTGKSSTSYLKLTPWGPREEAKEVSITHQLYEKVEIDEELKIRYQKGWLGIGYYDVIK